MVSLRNQKKLQAAYEEVQAANNAKRDLLSKMSHDIRTPMNAIMGITELIERHAGDRTVVEDYLKKLRISEKYLLTLLNAILDMGRIDSGKIELEHTFFSLKDMAEEVAVILHDMVDQKTQEFRIDIRDVRHIFVAGDKRKLEQTLINLLTNASNFTPQNGKILLRIEEEEEGNFVFTVKDNGIGIPEDQKKHILRLSPEWKIPEHLLWQGQGLDCPSSKAMWTWLEERSKWKASRAKELSLSCVFRWKSKVIRHFRKKR